MVRGLAIDDENPSDITFQTSDTTWQAYNWWGGYNLYDGFDGRASAVSYNRPIVTREAALQSGPQDFIFSAEYPGHSLARAEWLRHQLYLGC